MLNVKANWTKCSGDAFCLEVCPIDVFELQNLSNNPIAEKSVPMREDGILCMFCVIQWFTEAIIVEEMLGCF